MNKTVRIVTVTLILLVFTIGGIVGFNNYEENNKAASKSSYMTQTARKAEIDVSVAATGSVYAAVTKDVSANNSGEIKNLSVKEGDTVKAGDKLFTVDSQQIRQQVSSAKLNLEKQNLQMNKMKTTDDKNLQYLQIEDAQNSLNSTEQQYNDMTVTSPVTGVVTARNNNNGDNIQSGKTVLSVMDPTSLKVKAAVDELDISKVQVGQKAQIKFNAIEGKSFEGTVESISAVGSTTNNVTTYDVVISLKDKTGVMLGMTANVNVLVASKQDALVIPTEALIQRGDKNYVMIPSENGGSASTKPTENKQNANSDNNAFQQNRGTNSTSGRNGTRNGYQLPVGIQGKLVEITVGIQNESMVEITGGITEGQKVMIELPQSTASSAPNASKTVNRSMSGGMGFGGSAMGGGSRQGQNR